MNVIVSNKYQNSLLNLDVDIIKSITGEYKAEEIIEMFKNFFYSKMVLDVTALVDYEKIETYQTLVNELDASKIVFMLPNKTKVCTFSFLTKLVNIGIYNFTTNVDGVKYLLRKSNTKEDAVRLLESSKKQEEKKIVKDDTVLSEKENENSSSNVVSSSKNKRIIGIKNVTDNAGATTFTYLLLKEFRQIVGDKVVAIEINKNDFELFNDKKMISVNEDEFANKLKEYSDYDIILVDLNKYNDISNIDDIIFLIEPSIIKLNRLVRDDRDIFIKLKNKKIVLNKSLLEQKDVSDFEYEANTKIFYNMPPLNDRLRNTQISEFINKCNYINSGPNNDDNKSIFGLFRR